MQPESTATPDVPRATAIQHGAVAIASGIGVALMTVLTCCVVDYVSDSHGWVVVLGVASAPIAFGAGAVLGGVASLLRAGVRRVGSERTSA
jgi:hypothetical protein